jgi:carbamate kinase
MQRIVVAVGGNSLARSRQGNTIPEQYKNAETTCRSLGALIAAGHELILTHGNGPQVGNILLRVELAHEHGRVYRLPLDICVADTQGGIGYMLQQALHNDLRARGIERQIVSLVTQVLVDERDPDFQDPSKPVGPFLGEAQAQQLMRERGWKMREDAGRGWRRVVPSPKPLRVLEVDAVRAVLAAGITPISVGGGGVPVVERDGKLVGVEAVVDKDRATALLARDLAADVFVLSTGVDRVYLDWGKPTQRGVANLTRDEARRYLAEGQFPPGSMGPKIESALAFLDGGGKKALVTEPEQLLETLEGRAGTTIV